MSRRNTDEIGQLVSTCHHIFLVKYSFGQTAKETGRAIFQHLPTRTQPRCVRIKRTAELEQVVFVTSGAMKEQ